MGRSLGLVVTLMGIIGSVSLYSMLPEPDPGVTGKTKRDAYFELFKFFLTVVLVGGAGLIYADIKEREESAQKARSKARDRNRERQRQLEQFFRDLTHTYNNIKQQRRILRRGLEKVPSGGWDLHESNYWDCMNELNDLQLQLEFGRRLTKLGIGALEMLGAKVEPELRAAEKYLRKVTDEFEAKELKHDDAPGRENFILVPETSELYEFVRETREDGKPISRAREEFFRPLNEAYRLINTEITRLGDEASEVSPSGSSDSR